MGLPKLNRKGPDRPAELHKRIAALEADNKRLREELAKAGWNDWVDSKGGRLG